jgi:hypothetical protein
MRYEGAMALLTHADIEAGLRHLVREKVLVDWYSWTWTDGCQWTLQPAYGGCVTYDRDDVTKYLALAADVFGSHAAPDLRL